MGSPEPVPLDPAVRGAEVRPLRAKRRPKAATQGGVRSEPGRGVHDEREGRSAAAAEPDQISRSDQQQTGERAHARERARLATWAELQETLLSSWLKDDVHGFGFVVPETFVRGRARRVVAAIRSMTKPPAATASGERYRTFRRTWSNPAGFLQFLVARMERRR